MGNTELLGVTEHPLVITTNARLTIAVSCATCITEIYFSTVRLF